MTTVMQNEWNVRYNVPEWLYGNEPNEFFASFLKKCNNKGKLLLPAEGEGRNAVYAAVLGWQVEAFDFSKVARKKAMKWAEMNSVSINYRLSEFRKVRFKANHYDLIALIYNHMPPDLLNLMAQKYFKALKPDGTLIMEAFDKAQIKNTTGGPKVLDMLFDTMQIRDTFSCFHINLLEKETKQLNEGSLHKGDAEIIRLIATKTNS